MGQQLSQPSRILEFGRRKILYTCLEILSIRIDAAKCNLVSENKTQIDLVGRNFQLPCAAGYAHHGEHAVLRQHIHGFKHERRIARTLQDQVERAILRGSIGE